MLILDLGEGDLSLVKLYCNEKMMIGESKKNKKQVNDLKLVSYHISYSTQMVAFFFIQRNMGRVSGLYAGVNQSGVEFMVVHSFSDLKNMSEENLQDKSKS